MSAVGLIVALVGVVMIRSGLTATPPMVVVNDFLGRVGIPKVGQK